MKGNARTKICEHCSVHFIAYKNSTRFCSYKCALEKRKQLYHCKKCKIILSNYRPVYCRNCFQKESLNNNWKGDKVGYNALHTWIRIRLPKPNVCVDCKIVPPYDLANKSGKYKRNLSDWEWLCRKCHMIKDGRFAALQTLASNRAKEQQ